MKYIIWQTIIEKCKCLTITQRDLQFIMTETTRQQSSRHWPVYSQVAALMELRTNALVGELVEGAKTGTYTSQAYPRDLSDTQLLWDWATLGSQWAAALEEKRAYPRGALGAIRHSLGRHSMWEGLKNSQARGQVGGQQLCSLNHTAPTCILLWSSQSYSVCVGGVVGSPGLHSMPWALLWGSTELKWNQWEAVTYKAKEAAGDR